MNDNKSQRLLQLRTEIENQSSSNWVFPTENGIQGFLGTGGELRIMFVAERPSSENRGVQRWKDGFYEILKRNNLADSHVTDLIKSRAKVGDPYPDDIREDRRFFKCELDIIEPNLIFAVGDIAYKRLLSGWAENYLTTVRKIIHYSHAFRFNSNGKKVEQLEKQIQTALTEIKK